MKTQFLEKLKEIDQLRLPREHYLIWGSGPLAVREIRPANDVDLLVSKELWDELTKKFPTQLGRQNVIRIGGLEIWSDCLNLTDKIDEMLRNSDLIEGYPFMKLCYTIQWKEVYNRKKDCDDILMIKNFLAMHG
jgi:hypothetical protein